MTRVLEQCREFEIEAGMKAQESKRNEGACMLRAHRRDIVSREYDTIPGYYSFVTFVRTSISDS